MSPSEIGEIYHAGDDFRAGSDFTFIYDQLVSSNVDFHVHRKLASSSWGKL